MSLQEFRDLLLGITEKAYHFEAAQDAPDLPPERETP